MIETSALMETSGRSGAYFCPTMDSQFFYKTITKEEALVMKRIAMEYYNVPDFSILMSDYLRSL